MNIENFKNNLDWHKEDAENNNENKLTQERIEFLKENAEDARKNYKNELAERFNCKPEQIATNAKEKSRDTLYYIGDVAGVAFYNQFLDSKNTTKIFIGNIETGELEQEDVRYPETVIGNLNIYTSKKNVLLENIEFPKFINGTFNCDVEEFTTDIKLPDEIYGNSNLNQLKTTKNITFHNYIYGILDLRSLQHMEKGVKFPQHVGSLIMPRLRSDIYVEDLPNEIERTLRLPKDSLVMSYLKS